MDSILNAIKAQDPVEIVRLLEGRQVRLTLTFSSGQTVTGVPIRSESQRGAYILLMRSSLNADDIFFVRLDDLTAVQVHGYQNVAPLLTDGAVARSPNEVSPTRLELKRSVQDLSEKIHKETGSSLNLDVEWEKLPASEHDVHLNLRDLTASVRTQLAKVAADELGKRALSEIRVFRISHHDSENPEIKRDGSIIDFRINLARALPARLDNELNDKINGVL